MSKELSAAASSIARGMPSSRRVDDIQILQGDSGAVAHGTGTYAREISQEALNRSGPSTAGEVFLVALRHIRKATAFTALESQED
jgi:hypothetical protein